TGRLDHQVGTLTGELLHRLHGIGDRGVDDVVGAELCTLGQPAGSSADEDHLAGAELLAGLDGHQSDRAGADHDHGVTDDVAAGCVQAEQPGPGGGDEYSVVVRDVVRHRVQRADLVHRVLREAPV